MMKKSINTIALILLTGTAASLAGAGELTQRGPAPFSAYDLDANGFVSEQEFTSFRANRMAAKAAEGRRLRNAADNSPVFDEFDTNGDGRLSPEELMTGQQSRMQQRFVMGNPNAGRQPGMGRNRPVFGDFDLNSDGLVSENEFYEARNQRISDRAKQGFRMRGLSNARPFSELDTNSDGKLTPDEFFKAQAQHQWPANQGRIK